MVTIKANVFVLLAIALSAAMGYAEPLLLIPEGLVYRPPHGGVLVMEEYYGSAAGRDGLGSIAETTSAVTQRPGDLAVYNQNASKAYLYFNADYVDPLPDGNDNRVVIDIGINGWLTTNSGTPYSGYWHYESEGGKKFRIIMRPDNGGTLDGNNYVEAVGFPQNVPAVIRLTGDPATNNFGVYVNNNTKKILPDVAFSGTGNQIMFTTGTSTTNSIFYIAWIKVYRGIAAYNPPLSDPENPADLTGLQGQPDGVVNMLDLSLLAQAWLECTDPENSQECLRYWMDLE